MKVWHKKIYKKYYDLIDSGVKTFEIRYNEGYNLGDILIFKVHDENLKPLFDSKDLYEIVYIFDSRIEYFSGLEPSYVVLGIKKTEKTVLEIKPKQVTEIDLNCSTSFTFDELFTVELKDKDE